MPYTVIEVERLSKQYRLGNIGGKRLVDDVNRWWAKLRGKEDPLSKIGQSITETRKEKRQMESDDVRRRFPLPSHLHDETIWALRDVSFKVKQGEVLGVVGRNGAGKSTMLKILSRVTAPTSGEVRVKGRIASLLEVGTGFHPELTGGENIYLNGAILGMTKGEIRSKFDEIVEFSGVEKFIETPVKRYSSGMYVRLAFAVAAHLEPEILIVDEVLAVGDAEFQKKCLGKMHDVATGGRTVLFVSHNMQAISLLCNRALYFDSGTIAYHGEVQKAIERYLRRASESSENQHLLAQRPGSGEYRFSLARPSLDYFPSSGEKAILFQITRIKEPVGKMWLSAHIIDSSGTIVLQCDSRLVGTLLEDADRYAGQFRFTSPWLKPGDYRVDFFICAPGMGIVDAWEAACTLTISPVLPYDHSASEDGTKAGIVFADFAWDTQKHHP